MSQNLIEKMKIRASVLAGIRDFFGRQGYTEADVPILTPAVIPEAPIELFKTSQLSPWGDEKELYMLPSPEYYLKQLIAGGSGDIYCISRSFRNSEQQGHQHNPEFTMLEWYRMNADYMDSVVITEEFFAHLLEKTDAPALRPPFARMSMTEVFDRWTGFDLSEHCTGELSPEEERRRLRTLADGYGLKTADTDSWKSFLT